ncbi:MAG: PaaI family thioesterase [Chloroflexota bacterium]
MKIQNPNYRQEVEKIFAGSPFINDVGVQYQACGPGWCKTSLAIEPKHFQHSGVIHAGVLSTMADNTAGVAAYTLVPEGVNVLTIEFKINLLRAATGEQLVCEAKVLKPGRLFSIVESEIFAFPKGEQKLVCKATVTIGNIAP